MLYIDIKYIGLISVQLRNFKRKKDDLYNCSCPICGDSKKKLTKARGYFYKKGNSMYFKCHNCTIGMHLGTFLKKVFPSYYDEYVLERYKNGINGRKPHKTPELNSTKVVFHTLNSEYIQKINELPDAHYAKKYVIGRKIPEEQYYRIFFTDDFAALTEDLFPGRYPLLAKNEPRLVLPFFTPNNEVVGLQGRSFGADKAKRYVTVRASDEVHLVFGMELLNKSKVTYIVEGPIDSLFLPNAIAMASSDLKSAFVRLGELPNAVFVFDNEPRNKQIVELMENVIKSGHKICIWPSTVVEKDINDMVINGRTPAEVQNIIDNHVKYGLLAQLELKKWRKC